MNQPNIVLIMTDHFRRDALGASTPNLTRLAGEGVWFDNAYCASPLCQPARNSIITGLYPSQHGVCGNQTPPISPALRRDTFMHHLQSAGYYTALIGKHHYIDRYGVGMNVLDDDEDIRQYGFDYVFQVVDDGENLHNEDNYTAHLKKLGKLDDFRRACATDSWACRPHPFSEEDYVDGFIGRQASELTNSLAPDKPFYLNLSFVGPHPPYWHPDQLQHDPADMIPPLEAPDTETVRLKRAHYMDKCAIIDRWIGRLLAALQQRGLYDNTIIIFTSDHGDALGDYGIWDKRFFFESSASVPLIMAGPGIRRQVRQNGANVSKTLVSHLDLYPTIMDLADIPDASERRRPGRNLIPVLDNQPGSSHQCIFAELATNVMIRTPKWKLVFDPEQDGVQYLFNLAVDPQERCNLAGVAGYEGVTLQLVQQILGYRILMTQFTHSKEEQRLQRVRVI